MRNAQSESKNKIIWESDGFAAVLPSDKREVGEFVDGKTLLILEPPLNTISSLRYLLVMTLRNHFGLVTGMTGDGEHIIFILSIRALHVHSTRF